MPEPCDCLAGACSPGLLLLLCQGGESMQLADCQLWEGTHASTASWSLGGSRGPPPVAGKEADLRVRSEVASLCLAMLVWSSPTVLLQQATAEFSEARLSSYSMEYESQEMT